MFHVLVIVIHGMVVIYLIDNRLICAVIFKLKLVVAVHLPEYTI
jgi:hypothetical protein